MAEEKRRSELQSWYQRLIRWIGRLFGGQRSPTTRVTSRRYSSDRSTALYTLERDTPGAVQTWRITSARSRGSLLITLDSLPDLKQHYKHERNEARKFRRKYITSAEERALYLDGSEGHTHRISFTWLDWQGQKPRVKLLGVWDGDFAGFSRTYAAALRQRIVSFKDEGLKRRLGNRVALKISEAIATEILEMRELPGFPWEERIWGLELEEILYGYTQACHGKDFDTQMRCRSR